MSLFWHMQKADFHMSLLIFYEELLKITFIIIRYSPNSPYLVYCFFQALVQIFYRITGVSKSFCLVAKVKPLVAKPQIKLSHFAARCRYRTTYSKTLALYM